MTTQLKPLSEAQADHMRLLVEKLTEAQVRANKFVAHYAQTHGVPIGQNGWVFNQDEMCFVQMPAPPQGENGQEGS